ncbi:MAG: hypothetical protein H6737_30770 [Alphaproteobacteria bacterium]|nr:hypothetical protein [Alphaproteobacteria bacterium]
MSANAKASSCLQSGELDGWEVALGYSGEVTPTGATRLVVTAPVDRLPAVHAALVAVLGEPLSFLYRQKIDRRDPKPQGHPGRDFVALELTRARVADALAAFGGLLYRDARCEAWIRGGMNDQVVLDVDGTIYCYPDDPAFRDVLEGLGVPESPDLVTLEGRDYVRHWFRAEADADEDGLIAALRLAEVAVQRG